MMKTSKTLVALLLVLCMAMTFFVPATFAATETITFDFGNPDKTGQITGSAATLPAEPIKLTGNTSPTNDAYLLNCNSGRGYDIGQSIITFRANATKYWSAIKLCGINAGTYDLNLAMQMNTSGTAPDLTYAASNVYIMPYAAYAEAFTSTNMSSVLNVSGSTNTSNEDLRLAVTNASKQITQFTITRTAESGDNSTAQKLSMNFAKKDVVFPADGDYVILFRTTTKAAFGASGLTLTREIVEQPEVVGGGTLADALASATEGTTIQLAKDVTVDGNIEVGAGVKLDLNGKNLTAGQIGVSGALIDTGANPGLVKGTITCTSGNEGYLPLTDGEGYRLYKFTAASKGSKAMDADVAKFGFHVEIDNNSGYALASGLKMDVAMSWNGGTANSSTEGSNFAATWATAVAANENLDVVVTVKGLTGIEGFKLVPSITANGVTISMSEIALS